MSKRFFSILLALALCLTLFAGAWASEEAADPADIPAAEAAEEAPAAEPGDEPVPAPPVPDEEEPADPAPAPETDGDASGLILNVTSQAELTDALNKTEPVAEIHITKDFTVTEESFVLYDPAHLENYSDVVVTIEESVTLTVGFGGSIGSMWPSYEGDWETGTVPNGRMVNNGKLFVDSGGTIEASFEENNGEIIVRPFASCVVVSENNGTVEVHDLGEYRTSMGGTCVNNGTVIVEKGAEIEARMGSTILNHGRLVVDGIFYFGCFDDGAWFDPSDGTVEGSGYIGAVDVMSPGAPGDGVKTFASQMGETLMEGTDLRVGYLIEAGDYNALAAAFPASGEEENGNRYVIARAAADMTVTGEIGALGSIIIPKDVTVTVADGAELSTGLYSQGTIVVEAGGTLATTMGGYNALVSDGTLIAKEGSELVTQMGGSIVNRGSMTLDGTLICRVICHPDEEGSPSTDHVWFRNEGMAAGSGTILLDPLNELNDRDAVEASVRAALGEGNGIDVRWADAGLILNVTSQAELTDALNKSDRVSEIHITADFPVTEESHVLYDPAHIDYYSDVVVTVEEGVTLTVGDGGSIGTHWPSFEGEWNDDTNLNGRMVNNGTIIVENGGTTGISFEENNGSILVKDGGSFNVVGVNNGTVTVQSGGEYRTGQGDDCVNNGTVVIEEGAEMEARFGTTIRNRGELVLDGTLVINCFRYPDQNGVVGDHMWFESTKPVSGGGRVILQNADPESGEPDEINYTVLAARLKEMLQNDAIEVVFDAKDSDLEDFLDDLKEQGESSDVNGDGNFNEEDAIIVVERSGGLIHISGASLLLEDAYRLAAAYLLQQIVSYH